MALVFIFDYFLPHRFDKSGALLGRLKDIFPGAKIETAYLYRSLLMIPGTFLFCLGFLLLSKPRSTVSRTPGFLSKRFQYGAGMALVVLPLMGLVSSFFLHWQSNHLRAVTYWLGGPTLDYIASVTEDVSVVRHNYTQTTQSTESSPTEERFRLISQERSFGFSGYLLMHIKAKDQYSRLARQNAKEKPAHSQDDKGSPDLNMESRIALLRSEVAITELSDHERDLIYRLNPLNWISPFIAAEGALVSVVDRLVRLSIQVITMRALDRNMEDAMRQTQDSEQVRQISLLRARFHSTRGYSALISARHSLIGRFF